MSESCAPINANNISTTITNNKIPKTAEMARLSFNFVWKKSTTGKMEMLKMIANKSGTTIGFSTYKINTNPIMNSRLDV